MVLYFAHLVGLAPFQQAAYNHLYSAYRLNAYSADVDQGGKHVLQLYHLL